MAITSLVRSGHAEPRRLCGAATRPIRRRRVEKSDDVAWRRDSMKATSVEWSAFAGCVVFGRL